MSATGVTLSGSFENASVIPTGSGFEWGTTNDPTQWPSTNDVYVDKTYTSTSGSFTGGLGSLEWGTTYYYRAYVILNNSKYCFGEVQSFTTLSTPDNPGTAKGCMELPAAASGSDYYSGVFSVDNVRNYSYLYQYSTYTSLWTAYPLYGATTGGGYNASWDKNPNIPESKQVNCWSASYHVIYGETNYVQDATTAAEYYARGHQLPNADRNSDETMQAQTFYATNSTPQIHRKFNDAIWKKLEGDVRTIAQATDTVYVVTGAAFHKGSETPSITYIHPKGDPSKSVPVPLYYWKVLLKVKWTGSGSSRTVSEAKAIGVWIPHQQYNNSDYSSFIYSVDQIEQWTGFDFFANLPGGTENIAETNTSWSAFSSF